MRSDLNARGPFFPLPLHLHLTMLTYPFPSSLLALLRLIMPLHRLEPIPDYRTLQHFLRTMKHESILHTVLYFFAARWNIRLLIGSGGG
jgi:hypothetical protein